MFTEIKKFGNSKGIIIPAHILGLLDISIGDEVELKVSGGKLTIKPNSINDDMKESSTQMQALFNLQKYSVLQDEKLYSNDYKFAWEYSVYPFFDDGHDSVNQNPHECYEDFFLVTKNHIDWLSAYFDELSLEDKPFPSFYDLESKLFRYAKQDLGWDRFKLINACKYLYLRGMWTCEFDEMLKLHHPSEASWINRS